MTILKLVVLTVVFTFSSCNEELLEAVKSGNVEAVRNAFLTKVDLNVQNDKSTPLIAALQDKGEDMAETIIEREAKLAAPYLYNSQPIHYALNYLNKKDEHGNTPLHYAVGSTVEHLEIVTTLIRHGAKTEVKNYAGELPFHWAVKIGNVELALLFLARLGNPNELDNTSRAPLHLAVQNGHVGMAEMLLNQGATVDLQTRNGETSLHMAAEKGDIRLVRLLLDWKADPNAYTFQGFSCLCYAGYAKNRDSSIIIMLLISKGALPDKCNPWGVTALHHYAQYRNLIAVDTILNAGANIEAATIHSNTPVHYAASNGDLNMLQFLLFRGANLEAVNRFGESPLLLCSEKMNVANALIEAGAYFSREDSYNCWIYLNEIARIVGPCVDYDDYLTKMTDIYMKFCFEMAKTPEAGVLDALSKFVKSYKSGTGLGDTAKKMVQSWLLRSLSVNKGLQRMRNLVELYEYFGAFAFYRMLRTSYVKPPSETHTSALEQMTLGICVWITKELISNTYAKILPLQIIWDILSYGNGYHMWKLQRFAWVVSLAFSNSNIQEMEDAVPLICELMKERFLFEAEK